MRENRQISHAEEFQVMLDFALSGLWSVTPRSLSVAARHRETWRIQPQPGNPQSTTSVMSRVKNMYLWHDVIASK